MRKKYKSKYNENRNRFSDSGHIEVKKNSIPLFMKIAVIFSNVPATIGLVFTLFGGISFIVMLLLVDFNPISIPEQSPMVSGEITNVLSTNSSINDQQVYAYHYTYTAPNGLNFSGVSYSSTSTEQVGGKVTVKYNADTPEESIIVGMSSDVFPMWMLLFVGIFPLIGIIMLYFGLKKGSGNTKIIQFGKVAFGSYKSRESTNSSVNNQTVYKFYFDFIAADGNTYTATGETHNTFKLEDEGPEPIIYNSTNPEEAVLLDTLPKSVRRFFKEEIENKSLI